MWRRPGPKGKPRHDPGHQQRQQRLPPIAIDQPHQRRHFGQADAQPEQAGEAAFHSMRPMARNIHITLKKASATDGTANSQ